MTPNTDEKKRAFDEIENAVEVLFNYFNFRPNQTTESDFFKINVIEQKIAFLKKVMYTD